MTKLICTDIDGTLLNKERVVDPYTISVFKQLDRTFETILASSRMPKAMYYIQQALGIETMPLICYNGALILSDGKIFEEDKVLGSITIPIEVIEMIIRLAISTGVHISIFHNNTWIASDIDAWTKREINNTRAKPDSLLTVFSKEQEILAAHKIMLMGEAMLIDSIEYALISKKIVAVCRSKDTYLEITPIGTNKSKGLQTLLKKMTRYAGISMKDIMAFGDNYNDYELLSDVGYGIAVANAQTKLKEIAFAETKSNHEHGVAFYLEKVFLQH